MSSHDDDAREAGEQVRRTNHEIADRIEADWDGMALSAIRYRRTEGPSIKAVNRGLLLSLAVDGDPHPSSPRINGSVVRPHVSPPGSFHILPPETLFEASGEPGLRFQTYLNVIFPPELLAELAEDFRTSGIDPQFSLDDPFISALLEQIFNIVRRGDASPLYQQTASRFLLATLLQNVHSAPARRVSGGLPPWQLRRIQDYIQDRLAEDVSLTELAAIVSLTPTHFCRAFKQSTGLPPHAWLTARRIEHAQELMAAHPRMGLTEVALCVGYQSQAAFGVAFKRITGLTPGQWRRDRARCAAPHVAHTGIVSHDVAMVGDAAAFSVEAVINPLIPVVT